MPASKMPARHCCIDAKSPSTHTKTLASPRWSLYSHLYLYKAHMNPAIDVLRIVAEVSDLSDGNNCLLTLNVHHSRVLGYYQFLYPGSHLGFHPIFFPVILHVILLHYQK